MKSTIFALLAVISTSVLADPTPYYVEDSQCSTAYARCAGALVIAVKNDPIGSDLTVRTAREPGSGVAASRNTYGFSANNGTLLDANSSRTGIRVEQLNNKYPEN